MARVHHQVTDDPRVVVEVEIMHLSISPSAATTVSPSRIFRLRSIEVPFVLFAGRKGRARQASGGLKTLRVPLGVRDSQLADHSFSCSLTISDSSGVSLQARTWKTPQEHYNAFKSYTGRRHRGIRAFPEKVSSKCLDPPAPAEGSPQQAAPLAIGNLTLAASARSQYSRSWPTGWPAAFQSCQARWATSSRLTLFWL